MKRDACHPHAVQVDLRRAAVSEAGILAVARRDLLLRNQICGGHVSGHAANLDLVIFLVLHCKHVDLRARVIKAENRAVLGRLSAQIKPFGIYLVRLSIIHEQAFANAARRAHQQRKGDQCAQEFFHHAHSFCVSFVYKTKEHAFLIPL